MALTPAQLATPLLRRPYDLRHSGVTWRMNSRVPPTEVAAWAVHSVEVLMRVYARCVAGLEEVWIPLMEASLRPPGSDPPGGQAPPGPAGDAGPARLPERRQAGESHFLRNEDNAPSFACPPEPCAQVGILLGAPTRPGRIGPGPEQSLG
jgi:hypothetical protein